MNLTEMTRHGLAGQSATREEALQVLDSSNDELLSVIAAEARSAGTSSAIACA